ncbi:MAG TPA: ATP-binding protein [Gemmatimonadaceae bacterium]|nr:ATP-binding protein [Gemmatimonadaceae bacterium]
MSTPDRQRRRAAERGGIAGLRRYSRLFALALGALGVAELALFAGQRAVQRWQDHSRDVGTIARDAFAAALDRNGTALAHPAGLPPLAQLDSARLDSALDSLSLLTADNRPQRARVRDIAAAVAAWNAGIAESRSGTPADRERVADLFMPVRTRFAQFLTAEDVLYEQRRFNNLLLGLAALAAMLVPGGLLAGIVVAGGRRFAAQADQLAEQQDQLEDQAAELEHQVQELEAANASLTEVADAERRAREQAETEMRERRRSAAMLEAAMTSAPIGISIVDRDLRYVQVNDTIARITGLLPAAHVGRGMRDLNPDLDPAVEAEMRRVLATDEPSTNYELARREGATGRTLHLLLNFYPVRTSAGETIGLGIAVVDTTEQRELLQQFHHAQKLEAVGRLAAGIAHDFNNLLTVIRSYCDLALLEMAGDAPGRAEIQEIRSAGERAAALSRQMLSFSRKQAVIPRPLAVGEALRDMESMLQRVTGRGVHLEMRLDSPLGIAHIDPTQLEQVVMNLVINAVDAMPRGGRVEIEAGNTLVDENDARRLPGISPGAYVVVAVRDTGTGIDEETLSRIFDPFFTTKPKDKGTGLGLSTVYGIVHDAGGAVRVESRVGEGSTFCVYLPAEPAEGAALRRVPLARGDAGLARAGETVLVVEDEDALRAMLVRALRARGFTVLEGAHGGEALRVALEHQGRIDAVLSDVHMPGMDGRTLVDRLRVERPGLRVLFMSGSSGDERGEPVATAHSAFIAKPFAIDDLAIALRRVLDTPGPG